MRQTNKKKSGLRHASTLTKLPLATAIYFAISSAAFAQTDTQTPAPADSPAPAEEKSGTPNDHVATLEAVTVTAQKRTENLQKVPISIQVLSNQKLEQMHVSDFADYAKLLPSVAFQTGGPGFSLVYMRGVANGGDGNHSTSLPSVGMYLDEQPITTIQGALDIHMYDVARVEALAGPQGTLYGASSQAGTIRIITNKPDPSGYAAGYAVELNTISGGGSGYVTEGFVNVPIADNVAIRLVGWNVHDGGYIDNVPGSRTYPSSGITVDNSPGCVASATRDCTYAAKDNYNDVDTTGARLALQINLNDNWTITPTVMGQRTEANGNFSFDPNVGDQKLTHYYPEKSKDTWEQAALTIEGKIGNFDVVYAFAHLNRHDEVDSDYSDYSFWYDTAYGYGYYICSSAGIDPNPLNNGACISNLINPSQFIQGKDGYLKNSQELRISSPKENRFRFLAGLFWQQQSHDIQQDYLVNNFAPELSVTGWPGTLWLTKQKRQDNDQALFGEISYDITDKLTATGGIRWFKVDNSLGGYRGFGLGYDIAYGNSLGEISCISPENFHGAPCLVFDKNTKENNSIGRVNLTYQIDDSKMIYGTWSQGYRPGGINRRGDLPPYKSDYLTNWELGWKTRWADNRLSFNGAIFQEDWKDFQFSTLGANGLTEIRNANQAQIRGMETELTFAATYNLQLSGGFAWYDAELTQNYCGDTLPNGDPLTDCPVGSTVQGTDYPDGPLAPKGTQLPVTPKFKGNLTARYTFDMGSYEAFVQGALVYVGERTSDLRVVENAILGNMPSYTLTDFSAGIKKNNWALNLYVDNLFDQEAISSQFAQCSEGICGNPGNIYNVPAYPNGQIYQTPNQPRTIGIKFSQEF